MLVLPLDSSYDDVRDGALRALLDRRSQVGQREVMRRLHKLNRVARELIQQKPGQLAHAMRNAVLTIDDQTVQDGGSADTKKNSVICMRSQLADPEAAGRHWGTPRKLRTPLLVGLRVDPRLRAVGATRSAATEAQHTIALFPSG